MIEASPPILPCCEHCGSTRPCAYDTKNSHRFPCSCQVPTPRPEEPRG